jgi:hypothetical protein
LGQGKRGGWAGGTGFLGFSVLGKWDRTGVDFFRTVARAKRGELSGFFFSKHAQPSIKLLQQCNPPVTYIQNNPRKSR